MIRFFTGIGLFFCISAIFGQDWQSVNASALGPEIADRTLPVRYQIAEVDWSDLLFNLHDATVELVMPDGSLHSFDAEETSNFAPDLQSRYPNIKTYLIFSKSNQIIKGRLDISEQGMHAVIQHPNGEIYIDPLEDGIVNKYLIYHTKDFRVDPALRDLYNNHEHLFAQDPAEFLDRKPVRSPFARNVDQAEVVLRTYRFAVSCTGEYAQKHNGTKEGALSAINTALNRINFVLESEVAIRLELIATNDSLLFTDAATDPFTNGNPSQMALENNNFLTAKLGSANYDVGHVFGTNCSGVVGVSGGIGIVCGSLKGYGSSCEISTSDRFYIGIICHELGHQFGAEHTWNNCPSAPDDQFSSRTAFEPGSGSTIMSYAGACGDQNIQFDSDPYYHSNSIEAIKAFLISGGQCGESENTQNRNPTVEIKLADGFYIPILTPFKLTASAQDLDGDEISYSWEQFDPGVGVASLSPIEAPKGDAPIFRSAPPTSSPTRFFPELSKILDDTSDNTEVLPTYDRKLTFRATVRDHVENGGGVSWDQITFRATSQAGPFAMIEEDLPDTLLSGSFMELKWDVANTNLLPVDCQSVHLLLSLDGGQSFNDTLIANTANDGSEYILIPDVVSQEARILIEAADNVFFTVNSKTLVIERSTEPGFAIDLTPHAQNTCLPSIVSFVVESFTIGDYSDSIEIVGINLPEGVQQVSSVKLLPGDQSSVALDFGGVSAAGQYLLEFLVIAGSDTVPRSTLVEAVSSDFSDLLLLDPPMGGNSVSSRPTFTWQGSINADAYTLEVDDSPAFSNPFQKEVTSITATILDSVLTENTLYYWRVRPTNICGVGDYSDINTFHTANLNCQDFMGEDLPIPLSQSAIVVGQSNIAVENPGIVQDVNVRSIQGFHESFGDLIFTIRAPSGKEVTLLNKQCGFSNRTFSIGFDDQSLTPFSCQANFTNQVFIPMGSLDDFKDESAAGTWSLTVADSIIGSGGRIDGWGLELCGSLSPVSPTIVTADTARAFFANSSVIDDQVLAVTDDEATAQELIFTIVTKTEKGVIQLQGTDLNVGDQFSQADLNEGRVTYLHDGLDSLPDAFSVTVIDGSGGWLAPITIPITISTEIVAVRDIKPLPGIAVFPNPASDQLFVRNSSIPYERVKITITSIAGQVVFQIQTPLDQLRAFDVGRLTKGIYNLQIIAEEGVANLRFVKS